MLETKINLIITSFACILFSITAFYYIFADIVKTKVKRKREEKLKEERDCKRNEIVPPSLLKINDFMIDLDSVIGLALEQGEHIRVVTTSNSPDFIISLYDLKFIETTEEAELNSEYKILKDGYRENRYFYNKENTKDVVPVVVKIDKCLYPNIYTSTSNTTHSKHEEFEKLYNCLLKWKALRKLYLTARIKATVYDYRFYSLIKDIKFIDVEKDVFNKLHQVKFKVQLNSIYGVSNLNNKQEEKKNEKLVYIEDQPR